MNSGASKQRAAEKILNRYENPIRLDDGRWIRDFGFTNTRQQEVVRAGLRRHFAPMYWPHVEWTLDTRTAWESTRSARFTERWLVLQHAQERIFPAIRGAFPT